MKKKDLIFEQTQANLEGERMLKKALDFGCFKEFVNALPPKGLTIDPTPVTLNTGHAVLKATGRKSGKSFYIYVNPQRIVEVGDYTNEWDWECPALTQEKQKTNTQDLENLSQSIKNQQGVDCKETMRQLYTSYLAVKNGSDLDENAIKRVRANAQSCLIDKKIKRKLLLAKIPGINQSFEKIVNDLKSINPADTRLAIFRLTESDQISSLVKKTLNEIKKSKENKNIEKNLFESRMKIVLESLEDFKKLPKKEKVKKSFKTLREINKIQKFGIVSETLGTLFKSLYGNSYNSSVSSISEPLFNSIFTKISIEEDLKSKVMQNIQSKTDQLIASMDSCLDLSKFLTDVITEEYAKKLDAEKQSGLNIVQSSLMDAVDDEMFRKNLQTKLEVEVCGLYEKFTENAKNLMVRLSAL